MNIRKSSSGGFSVLMTRDRIALIVGAALAVGGGFAYAIGSTPPHTLEAGTPITATQLNAMFAELYAASTPPGSVTMFAGSAEALPSGWVPCDGKCYPQADPQYAALWAAIGAAHGQSSASTFCVPDLRGRFVRGVDGPVSTGRDEGPRMAPRPEFTQPESSKGASIGVGSQETDSTSLPNSGFSANDGLHTHDVVRYVYHSATAAPGDGQYGSELKEVWAGIDGVKTSGTGGHAHSITGGDSETCPENLALVYIIKL